jgi:hypothetical protein
MRFDASEDAAATMKIDEARQALSGTSMRGIDTDRQRPCVARQLAVVNPSNRRLPGADKEHQAAKSFPHLRRRHLCQVRRVGGADHIEKSFRRGIEGRGCWAG